MGYLFFERMHVVGGGESDNININDERNNNFVSNNINLNDIDN